MGQRVRLIGRALYLEVMAAIEDDASVPDARTPA
jgi:hypothetical protein